MYGCLGPEAKAGGAVARAHARAATAGGSVPVAGT
jgi:hypothetical protein